MSEVMKVPLILTAICSIGGGPGQIGPVFREAISKPFGNVWIALCYTFNNRASSRPRFPSNLAVMADRPRYRLTALPAFCVSGSPLFRRVVVAQRCHLSGEPPPRPATRRP